MDRHDVAQYGLIGALLIGGVSGYHALSSRPPIVSAAHVTRAGPEVWPPLSDAEIAALTAAVGRLEGKRITVYYANFNAADVAEDVAGALKAAGATVRVEIPVAIADGLQIGCDDPAEAATLAGALKGMRPKVFASHHGETYISFGRRL